MYKPQGCSNNKPSLEFSLKFQTLERLDVITTLELIYNIWLLCMVVARSCQVNLEKELGGEQLTLLELATWNVIWDTQNLDNEHSQNSHGRVHSLIESQKFVTHLRADHYCTPFIGVPNCRAQHVLHKWRFVSTKQTKTLGQTLSHSPGQVLGMLSSTVDWYCASDLFWNLHKLAKPDTRWNRGCDSWQTSRASSY